MMVGSSRRTGAEGAPEAEEDDKEEEEEDFVAGRSRS